ncbi:MAG: Hint domain-containing protein [Paracoccus sp. (in: a-proteobacteria)]|nr:Hint domain-containing protein [Paracoccus sp. (in: a-proteobacteria)]
MSYTSTVDWLYIGNHGQTNANPRTPPTQTDANKLLGMGGTGPDELAAVELTGTTHSNGMTGGRWFLPEYYRNVYGRYPDSQFTYQSPTTGEMVTGQTITGVYVVDVEITLPDGTTTTRTATAVQMSNGDMFIRPYFQRPGQLDGIDKIESISIVKAAPPKEGTNTYLDPKLSWGPGIHDIIFICFTAGTMIATPSGEVAVEDLRAGDMVSTVDNGAQMLRWAGHKTLGAARLEANPRLLPIRIRAGALGPNTPSRDLLVSPQHRVLVRSRIAQRMFGTDEVLVAAKQLCQIDGIDIATELDEVVYVHLLFDRHEVLMSNGAATESLYTGAQALKMVGAAAREEIFAIFPELADGGIPSDPAREFASGRRGRKLAVLHAQKRLDLVA